MYDIVIKNGLVFDGLGKEGESVNLGIKDGKIQIIASSQKIEGREEINAENRYISPGFIDINNEADHYLHLFSASRAENLIRQGITTIIGGNDGVSLAPLISGSLKPLQRWINPSQANIDWRSLDEFFVLAEKKKIDVNFGTLLGWETLRTEFTGQEFKNLTNEELAKLKLLVKQGLEQGAFGVSFDLSHAPEQAVGFTEILMLTELINRHHGYLSFRLRDEGVDFLASIDEVIELSQRGNVSVEVENLQVIAPSCFKDFPRALKLITRANQKHELVNFSLAPYDSTSQVLTLLLPQWIMIGGRKIFLKNISQAPERKAVIQELKRKSYLYRDLIIADAGRSWWLAGKTLKEVAKDFGINLEDALLKILQLCEDRVIVFSKNIAPENVKMAVSSPYSFIASNSGFYQIEQVPKGVLVHPQSFGSFPHFLGEYVRERKLLNWQKAIHKLTGKVAQKTGLKKRGIIKNGYWADLVVFNPKKINSKADLNDPFQYPQGIETVIINGKIAYQKGRLSEDKYGKVLKK